MVGVEKVRHQILANLFCPIIRREFGFHQSRRAAGRGEERVRHGSVRPAVDVLHLLGPLPEPKAAAMPALLLHGAVHGGARGLRQETSKGTRLFNPMQHFLLCVWYHPRPCIQRVRYEIGESIQREGL